MTLPVGSPFGPNLYLWEGNSVLSHPHLAGLSAGSTATQHCLRPNTPRLFLTVRSPISSCHTAAPRRPPASDTAGSATLGHWALLSCWWWLILNHHEATTSGNIRTLQQPPKSSFMEGNKWTSHTWTSSVSGWYSGISCHQPLWTSLRAHPVLDTLSSAFHILTHLPPRQLMRQVLFSPFYRCSRESTERGRTLPKVTQQ